VALGFSPAIAYNVTVASASRRTSVVRLKPDATYFKRKSEI
jgi:hypothetical protein